MSTGDGNGKSAEGSLRSTDVVYAVLCGEEPSGGVRTPAPERTRHVASVDELDGGVEPVDPLVVLAESDRHLRRAEEFVASRPAPGAVVAVVDDPSDGANAVEQGAHDYVVADESTADALRARLRTVAEVICRHAHRDEIRRKLEREGADLVGFNALASGIADTLDRDVIVRRGLWIFTGLTGHEAAAFLELRPLELPVEVESDEGPRRLERIASLTTDELEVSADAIELDDSWKRVVESERIAVLDEQPDEDVFPGLDPFWSDHPDERIMLLPVTGNRAPLGALVLAMPRGEHEANLSREGLQAMAQHLGSALENAHLYEQMASTYESLQETQDQLVHAEKFAAVGVLAAEIAHEINNPASFVISNLSVMDEYAESITDFLDRLDDRLAKADPGLREDIDALKEDFEIAYMRDDLDALLSRSLSGMQRIHQVVQDLRYLSRGENEEVGWVELEGLLEATVNLVSHEAKFRAELRRDYDDVPQVMSNASRLSQVFLNLLVNAVQAIEEGEVEDNYVRIGTRRADDQVVVTVEDTGTGIPEEARDRIFEPFFTTKETGEGTGLGLSIARDIVRSLGGAMEFETEPGEGTEFRVAIPIRAEHLEGDRDLRDSGYFETPPGLDEISDDIFEE